MSSWRNRISPADPTNEQLRVTLFIGLGLLHIAAEILSAPPAFETALEAGDPERFRLLFAAEAARCWLVGHGTRTRPTPPAKTAPSPAPPRPRLEPRGAGAPLRRRARRPPGGYLMPGKGRRAPLPSASRPEPHPGDASRRAAPATAAPEWRRGPLRPRGALPGPRPRLPRGLHPGAGPGEAPRPPGSPAWPESRPRPSRDGGSARRRPAPSWRRSSWPAASPAPRSPSASSWTGRPRWSATWRSATASAIRR